MAIINMLTKTAACTVQTSVNPSAAPSSPGRCSRTSTRAGGSRPVAAPPPTWPSARHCARPRASTALVRAAEMLSRWPKNSSAGVFAQKRGHGHARPQNCWPLVHDDLVRGLVREEIGLPAQALSLRATYRWTPARGRYRYHTCLKGASPPLGAYTDQRRDVDVPLSIRATSNRGDDHVGNTAPLCARTVASY